MDKLILAIVCALIANTVLPIMLAPPWQAIAAGSATMVLLLLALELLRRGRYHWRDESRVWRTTASPASQFRWIVALVATNAVLQIAAAWLSDRFPALAPARADALRLDLPAAINVAVVVPVIEELVFRGWLLRALFRRLGRPSAIAISSVAFGAVHGLPLSMFVNGVFGAALACSVLRTGRLMPAILAHGIANAIGLTLSLAGVSNFH